MKRVVIGMGSVLSGVLLLGLTNIAAVIYAAGLTEWYTHLGLYGTALAQVGSVPVVLSLVLIGIGTVFLLKELRPNTVLAIKRFFVPSDAEERGD